MSFNRYSPFISNGSLEIVPFIEIRKNNTDKFIKYNKKNMRFDKLSYEYYNSPDYAWLIMQANPEYGSIENFIKDGVILRIPYPIDVVINNYINDIKSYKELNG
jgi:hypothetical protein